MMNPDFTALNYLAIAVAALATFFLGALWYTALFGKMWLKLNAYTEEKMKEMHARHPPPVFFGVMLAAYFVIALVFAVLAQVLKIDTWASGMIFGYWLWIIAAAIQITGHISSDRHWGIYFINMGYQIIYLIMMGTIIGAWR